MMSEIQIPGWEGLGIACPQNMDLNKWARDKYGNQ